MPTAILTASLDATLDQSLADTNTGSAVVCSVNNFNGSLKKRTLLCFNTSAIPANATISSALLSLYCVTAAAGGQPCHAAAVPIYSGGDLLALPPVEAQVTWNDRFTGEVWQAAGGDIDIAGVVGAAFTCPIASGVMPDIDVTAQVIYARATWGYAQMVGLHLKQTSGTNRTYTVASKENVLGYAVPTLTVAYSLPGTHKPVVGNYKKPRIRI